MILCRIFLLKDFFLSWLKITSLLFVNLIFFSFDILFCIYIAIKSIVMVIADFLGPVNGAISGRINLKEFFRILTSASSIGGGSEITIKVLQENSDKWISDPATSAFFHSLVNGLDANKFALCLATLVFVGDIVRRFSHGD